jgi:photosystem II stability/assembly factor-like uncharacterized protein
MGWYRWSTVLPVLVALGGFGSADTNAQTTIKSGAADVRSLHAVSSSTWLAATRGSGVQRTVDQGANWVRVPTDNNVRRLMRYANRLDGVGNTVYVATDGGLFRSTDSGNAWTQLTAVATAVVAVDPNNAQNLMIGVVGAGVARSTDGGTSFTEFNAGLPSADVRDIKFANSTTAYVALYSYSGGGVTVPGGVFRSVSGAAWTDFNAPGGGAAIGNQKVVALELDGSGALYAATADFSANTGNLFKTSGNGWSKLEPKPGDNPDAHGMVALHRDRNNGNRIWVGFNYQGPTVTSDGGASFQFAHNLTEQSIFSGVYAFLTAPGFSGVVRAVEGAGLFRTAGSGSPSNDTSTQLTGITGDRVLAFARAPSQTSTFYMGLGGNGGVLKSIDGGTSWTRIVNGFENKGSYTEFRRLHTVRHIAVSPTDPNTAYAASEPSGLYFTTNGGTSWTPVAQAQAPFPNPSNTFVRAGGLLAVSSNDILYSLFAPSSGVFRGSQNSWVRSTFAPAGIAPFAPERIVRGGSGRIYALLNDQRPAVSTNGGSNFTLSAISGEAASGFSRIWGLSLAENPTANSTVVMATNKGIYRSTDSGANFARVATSGLETNQLTGLAFAGNALFGGDRNGTFYCSNDNGTTWITKGTLVEAINDVLVYGSTLHLLTDGAGVLTMPATCP